MTVYINNLQQKISINQEVVSILPEVVNLVLKEENKLLQGEVGIIFVDNEYIRELNLKYRQQDRPTDVLSFSLSEENDEEDKAILGDIVISLEEAAKQAEVYKHSTEEEIVFLTIHGLLHLLGYDHEDLNDEIKMEERQHDIWEKVPWGRKR